LMNLSRRSTRSKKRMPTLRADQEEAAGDIRRDMYFELPATLFWRHFDPQCKRLLRTRCPTWRHVGCLHYAGWSDRPSTSHPTDLPLQRQIVRTGSPARRVWDKERLAEVDTLASTPGWAIKKDVKPSAAQSMVSSMV
jgi:hypothetical protein